MGNLAQWAIITGFILPPVLAIIQQQAWSSQIRASVTFVVAVIVGLGVVYFKGDLDFDSRDAVVSTVLLVLTTAVATYHGFFQPTGIAPRIEAATSPKPTADAR